MYPRPLLWAVLLQGLLSGRIIVTRVLWLVEIWTTLSRYLIKSWCRVGLAEVGLTMLKGVKGRRME